MKAGLSRTIGAGANLKKYPDRISNRHNLENEFFKPSIKIRTRDSFCTLFRFTIETKIKSFLITASK